MFFFFRFFEIFINTPLNVCEARDVKGLYKKARDGLISGFTGVSQNYEEPENPDLIVSTVDMSLEESTKRLIDFLESKEIIPKYVRGLDKVSYMTSPHTWIPFKSFLSIADS